MRLYTLTFLLLLLLPLPASGATLLIQNDTDCEIINILIQPKGGTPFFARLDLLPGDNGEIENPDCTAGLRIDTGLELWTFPEISLQAINKLTFSDSDGITLAAQGPESKNVRSEGIALHLAPAKGDRPVCHLSNLRPAMPMKEVCSFLPSDIAYDDNGALLTGLGFGGMTWASRLIPAQPGQATEASRLEHMELRRPLTRADLDELLKTLAKQRYMPWQAEFPGKDMDFAETSDSDAFALLHKSIDDFLASAGSHKKHSLPACSQASIIMAPAERLAELNASDEPETDVQIFTIVLRPCTRTLLLDVAAYKGQNQAE